MTGITPFSEIQRILPSLSVQQLQDLSNRCKILLNTGVKKQEQEDDWLLEGMLAELRTRGIPIPSQPRIKQLQPYKAYIEKSKEIRNILESKGNFTKLEKRQLAIICSKCLITYLSEFTDISIHSLLTFIDRLPEAVDREFPGYLRSNLILFLVRHNAGQAD